MLIDSHTHIHFSDFKDDVDAVLSRSREAGVSHFINVATDLDTSREVIAIAEQHPDISAVVGVHPHDVAKMEEGDFAELEILARHPKVVAIGEVGLDYHYEHSPREIQQSRLADFIRLAKSAKKPLVIHCRDAFEDCFRIFDAEDAWSAGGVFHCFTGDRKTAEAIIAKGFYVSFSGILTFRKATDLHEAAKAASLDYCLVETDAPFLAPEPHRGKRNEPSYVVLTARKLAALKGLEENEVFRITSENAKRLFKIPG